MNSNAKWILITGGALTLGGPAIGALGIVIGMMGSFDTLGKEGVSDPKALASQIGVSLVFPVGGFIIGVIGVVVLIAGLIILFATKSRQAPPPIPEK